MNLLALTVSLFGELTILVFSLWLLFRSTAMGLGISMPPGAAAPCAQF